MKTSAQLIAELGTDKAKMSAEIVRLRAALEYMLARKTRTILHTIESNPTTVTELAHTHAECLKIARETLNA